MTLSFESLCASPISGKLADKVHTLPLQPSTSFDFDSLEASIEVFKGKKEGYVYSRYSNPTVKAVADKLAMLESFGSDLKCQAYLLSSGMSAIHTLILSILNTSDKIIVSKDLYGGTLELFNKVHKRLGLDISFLDFDDLVTLETHLKDEDIKAVFFETPTNPLLKCYDLRKISGLCQKYGVKSIVDNTFCTSYLQRPLTMGVDFVVYSATKYLSGHGVCTAGAVISHHKSFMREQFWTTLKLNGAICSPFEAWNLNNGLKTLCLRMERQCSNALSLAKNLENHPAIKKVYYPGLDSSPYKRLSQSQMKYFGAVISIEIDESKVNIFSFANRLKLISNSPTVGDLDSLLLHPASSSHLRVDPRIREQTGITDALFRLSIGIEDSEDLLKDITNALT